MLRPILCILSVAGLVPGILVGEPWHLEISGLKMALLSLLFPVVLVPGVFCPYKKGGFDHYMSLVPGGVQQSSFGY